ncbi:single-stranded DNA-binding protein [Burkholderia thailandensis]|uniref:single-stranded DNA-binding protein n=1 Tax=Burkholderia thailandensis TaxID=57975 RepID=UPI0003EC980F|nr:single-stranded DNA-binding protein [Burkholderia thailandensis]AHI65848.1 single-strand binding family protein [Burkholderia thailandensis H0587]MCZ2895206.1 single-stranded DNA-binding protein [Burkholderia thailandensis]TGB31382.1 single-stranded DNA-binding protein [Burkholderia thailandensis]
MIDALIGGKLYGKPQNRTAQSRTVFVVAKVRAVVNDGEALFVSVIAFSDGAKAALLALDDGDSVALAGTLTPKVWTDRNGDAKPALDMVAHAVLSAYHVKRKRAAVQGANDGDERGNGRPAMDGARQAALYGGDTSGMADDL